MTMAKEVSKMDSKKTHPALKFMYWQKFCWDTKDLPVGLVSSTMMEKLSNTKLSMHYFMH